MWREKLAIPLLEYRKQRKKRARRQGLTFKGTLLDWRVDPESQSFQSFPK